MQNQLAKLIFYLLLIVACNVKLAAQDKPKMMDLMRDSTDQALDMSDFLIQMHGFIPVPQLITEPALGSFGFMLAPVFITPNKYQKKGEYVAPNITAAFGAYTANKTWLFGAMRIASLPKYKLKYRVGAGYGNINMDFYRTLPVLGEQKFSFNFQATIIYASLLKEIANTNVYVGLDYLFVNNDVTPEFSFSKLPDFIDNKDLSSNLSSVGFNVEYDMRDNMFTPNKGLYVVSNFRVNADWTGSDYTYQNLTFNAFQFFQTTQKLVSGFRFSTKLQFGDAPFYTEPFINLRGVPMARYQGTQTYVVETEQRYDFTKRWSGVFFGGLAKAPTEKVDFNESLLVYNYGTGFRYLLARKFKLRVGIDVAWSNSDFGYYIVFGSAWNNRS